MTTRKQRLTILLLCCLFFFSLGTSVAAYGPLLPELALLNQVNLTAIGGLYTFYFLGSLFGQFISGPLSDRYGEKPLLLVSALLLTACFAALPFSANFALSMSIFALIGLGAGSIVLTANILVARVFAHRSVSALNLLNLFFGLGAFFSPAMVGYAIERFGQGRMILWLVGGLVGVQFILFLLLRVPPPAAENRAETGSFGSLLRSRLVWLLAALLLIYVGIENGLGGWVTVYMNRTTSLSLETAALAASAFWLALTAGRLVTVWLGMRLTGMRILALSMGGALAGSLLMVLGRGSIPLSVAGILLTGFSFGSIFPSVVSLTGSAYPAQPGKAMTIVNGMASIGAMILPWLQGILLNNVSPLASTLLTLGGVIMMSVLLAAARPLYGQTRAHAHPTIAATVEATQR